MPNPWPPLEVGPDTGSPDSEAPALLSLSSTEEEPEPGPAVRSPFPGGTLVRSRLALAASVALLVSGSLFLGGMQNASTEDPIKAAGGTANRRDGLPTAPKEPVKIKDSMSFSQTKEGTAVELNLFEVPPGK
jgi:hypothetical protein